MRRNFYELATVGPAPIASEALKHTAGLGLDDDFVDGSATPT